MNTTHTVITGLAQHAEQRDQLAALAHAKAAIPRTEQWPLLQLTPSDQANMKSSAYNCARVTLLSVI
jgi:hypothetical protein